MTPILDSEVTASDLAALAGCTDRRIRQLTQEGKLTRSSRGKFKLGDSVRVLLALAADNNDGTELQRERLRKLKAEAGMAELELARARNEVAPIAQMERLWERAFATVRANMLAIPSRVVTSLIGETDERRFKSVLSNEIKQALNSAADLAPEEEELTDDNEITSEE